MDSIRRNEQKDVPKMTSTAEISNVHFAQRHIYRIQLFTLIWKQSIQQALTDNNYCLTQAEEEEDQRRMRVELQLSIQSQKTTLKHLIKAEDQLM